MNVPLLGQIPIVQSICEGGDNGTPVALDEEYGNRSRFLVIGCQRSSSGRSPECGDGSD